MVKIRKLELKTMLLNNLWKNLQQNECTQSVCFSLDYQFFHTILQFLNSDWPVKILAGMNFWTQENGLILPDGVCAISTGPLQVCFFEIQLWYHCYLVFQACGWTKIKCTNSNTFSANRYLLLFILYSRLKVVSCPASMIFRKKSVSYLYSNSWPT